jgi:hypothetical protein
MGTGAGRLNLGRLGAGRLNLGRLGTGAGRLNLGRLGTTWGLRLGTTGRLLFVFLRLKKRFIK